MRSLFRGAGGTRQNVGGGVVPMFKVALLGSGYCCCWHRVSELGVVRENIHIGLEPIGYLCGPIGSTRLTSDRQGSL